MKYYVRNDNNRSRYDKWKKDLSAKGFVRSGSHPKFFRTASKNQYVRDSSKLRSNSRPGSDFTGPGNNKQGERI